MNPGDSANPDNTKSLCIFCKDITGNGLMVLPKIVLPFSSIPSIARKKLALAIQPDAGF
jgi:hypothetical protein